MARPAKLNDIEIQRELGSVKGWTRRGDSLAKTFAFPAFLAGIHWVNKVAEAAERLDHHPDLDIRYNKIHVTLSTHSAGGITSLDFSLAKEMDLLAG